MSVATKPEVRKTAAGENVRDFSARAYGVSLAVLIVLAAFLRFWHLGTRGFFIDEGYSWAIAKLPWGEFLRTLTTRTGEMPLHYILMKLWIGIGQSEFVFRIPGAIFGIAVVALIAETGKRLYSRRAGIFAAAFLTVHLFAIKYAQEARTYPMVMMFIAAGWLQLTRAVQNPSRRNWIWFSVISIFSVYSHLLAGLGVAAQYLTLLLFPLGRLGWRRVGESVAITAAGLSPAVLYAMVHERDLEWIRPTRISILLDLLDNMSGLSGNRIQSFIVLFLFVSVAALFVLAAVRFRLSWNAWVASVPVIGFAFPVVALIILSKDQPIFVPRYLGYILVPLLLGLAWLCTRLTSRLPEISAGILLVLLSWSLRDYYRASSCYHDPAWQDFRGAVQYIIQREKPGDSIIVFEPMARPAVEYYGSRSAGFPKFMYPNSGDHFRADDMLMRPDPYELPGEMARSGRVWMLYNFEKSPEEYKVVPVLFIRRTLAKTHHLISVQTFKSARVEEFVP